MTLSTRVEKLQACFDRLPIARHAMGFSLRDLGRLIDENTDALAELELYLGEGHTRVTGQPLELADLPCERALAAAVTALLAHPASPRVSGDLWASYLLWRQPSSRALLASPGALPLPSIPPALR